MGNMKQPTSGSERRIILRRDAFFGLHFDLHPQATDTSLGADTSKENIGHLLRRVKPDYVQYDCKGHTGYTGYPTTVGWPSPGIVQDALAIWREVTREHGVGLYIHYSGVYDDTAIAHHPEWARVDAEGKPDSGMTSTFGGYVDGLLIPQLKEATAIYDLDGAWVDGECWAARLDYSPAALEKWRQVSGFRDAPKDSSDPRWLRWKMFHRRQFENYLIHWVDELHAFNPNLQVTSNWMYTTFAPKPVEARLDFLSGDYSPNASVDRARVEARYLASTGMPWDLMAWGFNFREGLGHSLKLPPHLEQEASVVLMQGGGFQIYYQPTRSGYVVDEIVETSGQVADFCRARQEVSHGSASVPQVALLLSSETLWDRCEDLFTSSGRLDELEGALHALLELFYSVDVLAEHQLLPRLAEFPLVVIPDSYALPAGFVQGVLEYVQAGGSLLLLGEKCCAPFGAALGVRLEGEPQQADAELPTETGLVSVPGIWQKVSLETAQAVGWRYPTRDTRKGGEVAATVQSHGLGKIGAVYGPVALTYFNAHHPALRTFIGQIAHCLFPDPAVRVEAPPCLDIALRRTRDGRLSLHMLNLAGVQRADHFLNSEWIPPLGAIGVHVKAKGRPRRVVWAPDGVEPEWTWADGTLRVNIERLEIHGVLIVDAEEARDVNTSD